MALDYDVPEDKRALYWLGDKLIDYRTPMMTVVLLITALFAYWSFQLRLVTSFGDLLPEVPVGAPSRLDALVLLDPAPGDLARRLVSQVDFEYARDVAALRYFLSDDEAQILDRAHRAERHIVDAALKRVRMLTRDDLRDALPA